MSNITGKRPVDSQKYSDKIEYLMQILNPLIEFNQYVSLSTTPGELMMET